MRSLIICNSYKELNAIIFKYKLKGKNHPYSVATNNVGFYTQIIDDERFKTIYLETEQQKPEERVWAIIDNINSIVGKCTLYKKSYLYEATYLMEGFGLPMQISNLILTADVIIKVLNTENISRIYFANKTNYLLEFIIVSLMKNQGKDIELQLFNLKFKSRNKEKIPRRYYFSNNSYDFRLYLLLKVERWFKFFHMVILKRKYTEKTIKEIKKFEIGILFSVDAIKHVNWLLPFLKIIEGKFRYNIICIKALNSKIEFEKMGYSTINAEGYFNPTKFLKEMHNYNKDIKTFLIALKGFEKVYYKDVDLTKIIVSYIKMYLWDDVFHNVLYENILNSFYEYNKFLVLTGTGDTNFIENKISYFSTVMDYPQPEFFKDQSGVSVFSTEIREPYCNIFKTRFLSLIEDEERLRKNGWLGKALFSNGIIYQTICGIKKENLVKGKINILWAPSYVVSGQNSLKAFSINNQEILLAAKEGNYKIYVKYHCRENDELINDIYEKFIKGNEEIHLLNKNASIEPLIKKVDLVLTNASVVLLDAINLKKPVICIASDQSFEQVKCHKRGIEIFADIFEMKAYLHQITESIEKFSAWAVKYVVRQTNYYNSLFVKDIENPEEIMINYLQQTINSQNEKILSYKKGVADNGKSNKIFL